MTRRAIDYARAELDGVRTISSPKSSARAKPLPGRMFPSSRSCWNRRPESSTGPAPATLGSRWGDRDQRGGAKCQWRLGGDRPPRRQAPQSPTFAPTIPTATRPALIEPSRERAATTGATHHHSAAAEGHHDARMHTLGRSATIRPPSQSSDQRRWDQAYVQTGRAPKPIWRNGYQTMTRLRPVQPRRTDAVDGVGRRYRA